VKAETRGGSAGGAEPSFCANETATGPAAALSSSSGATTTPPDERAAIDNLDNLLDILTRVIRSQRAPDDIRATLASWRVDVAALERLGLTWSAFTAARNEIVKEEAAQKGETGR
jgi:hypothetical protein